MTRRLPYRSPEYMRELANLRWLYREEKVLSRTLAKLAREGNIPSFFRFQKEYDCVVKEIERIHEALGFHMGG